MTLKELRELTVDSAETDVFWSIYQASEYSKIPVHGLRRICLESRFGIKFYRPARDPEPIFKKEEFIDWIEKTKCGGVTL